jgi:hypothetical protein
MKIYLLTMIEKSADSHDPPEVLTAVFSTQEKAYASLVDFCRKTWDCLPGNHYDGVKIPANDDDIVTQYFDLGEEGDGYSIEAHELDDAIPIARTIP